MRARRNRRRSWRSRTRLFWIYVEILTLLLLAIFLGVIGGTFYSVSKMLPTGLDITDYDPTEATKIISSDGVILAGIFEENREVVPLTDIPKNLQNATIAIEDERFYSHLGVDFRGIARALYQNFRTGHIAQGGSTLTQQLARNIYLTHEKKISRKLQEIVLALELERNYSKEQILELYLNQVYYGSGTYGVQTASRIYFGKDVKDLSLSECALLAGLPQKPSVYSPYENLDAAIRRRDAVLERMVKLHYIDQSECDEAENEGVKLVGLQPIGISRYKAPWFVTYIMKQITDKYGADLLYRGGLKIYTTLNYEMQQAAEEELRKGVTAAKSRHVTQGALICIDPYTGHIKAMVGGVNPNFTKDQFNRAVQAHRQPGSAFKAFVYSAAVDNGYDSNYMVSNKPIMYKGKPWPDNYSRSQSASVYSMRQAIGDSVNRCAVNMTQTIGINQVITYARMLGIQSPLDENLSLALGASVVTPLEICSAYGVFAANGIRAEPISITRISESEGFEEGTVIEENEPITHQVLSEQTTETMSRMFRGVVTNGTGYAARRVRDSHGKTGTTSSDRDAWFIGYTDQLVTAVWVGNDDYSPMNSVWGGNVCAPTWAAFMLKALRIHDLEHLDKNNTLGLKETDSVNPDKDTSFLFHSEEESVKRKTLTICTESSLLATKACPKTRRVTFDVESEPHSYCTLHKPSSDQEEETPPYVTPPTETSPSPTGGSPGPSRPGAVSTPTERYVTVNICVDSGQIANTYCPETISRTFKEDEVPTKRCKLHRPPSE